MNFHNINLPKFVEIFAVGGPHFSSSSATTLSGREIIALESEYAKQKYKIKNCILSEMEFEQFNVFFRARMGKNFAFRFRDNGDCKVVKQQIGMGDGFVKIFPLFKLYEDQVASYYRRITKPVKGSLNLYIDNSPILANVNYEKGIIELEAPLPEDKILVADFMFDVAVRFGADNFEYNMQEEGAFELSEIELIEVIE